MINLKKSLFLILLCFIITSCSSSIIEEVIASEIDEEITYEKDIQPIMANSCATTACHGSTTNPAGGLSLITFEEVKTAVENNELIIRINSNSNPMPPTGLLNQATRTVIEQWVSDGFIEN